MNRIAFLLCALCIIPRAMAETTEQVAKLPDAIASRTKYMNPEFLLHLPKGADASVKRPLMIFLHGRGERGQNIQLVKKHGPPKLVDKKPDFPFVLASPQCTKGANGRGWWHVADLELFLEHVKSYSLEF